MEEKKRKKLTPLGLLATVIYTIFILVIVFWLGYNPVSIKLGPLVIEPLLIFMIIFVASMVLFIALLRSSGKMVREE